MYSINILVSKAYFYCKHFHVSLQRRKKLLSEFTNIGLVTFLLKPYHSLELLHLHWKNLTNE